MTITTQSTISPSVVRSGVTRPRWICCNVKQRVVVVRDRSASMKGQKAEDASAASNDFVAELAQPCNKDGFDAAVVDFSTNSDVVHDFERAQVLHGCVRPLSQGPFGGSTNITAGLRDAFQLLDQAQRNAQQGVTYLRPVVILFTDGQHNHGPHPRDAAVLLKNIADLVTVAFGPDASEALLRDLASTPRHFYRCSNGNELRRFLAAVGATVTATMQAGTNATQALTQIQQ